MCLVICRKNYRFLGNKWLDRYYGFSIKSTKPGVPKFRLEWSYILSPSATNAADSSSSSYTTEKTDFKERSETQIRNMEFSPTMLNNWVFFLHLKVKKLMKTIQLQKVFLETKLTSRFQAEFYGDTADKKACQSDCAT